MRDPTAPPCAAEAVALAALRAAIRDEGLDRPTPVRALAIFALHVAMMFAGMIQFFTSTSVWLQALAFVVSTYGALGIGMTGHNASHRGVTGNRRVDRALTYFAMTVLAGLSTSFWRHKHIRLHHASPNAVGLDIDIDLMPYFALNADEFARSSGWRRRFYRLQHWVFPFALGLNMVNLQLCGIRYLIELRRERRWTAGETADVLCLLLHVLIFIVLPALYWSVGAALLYFLLREASNGYAVFISAAPAHFPAEARFIAAPQGSEGLLARQIFTTVNFRTGLLGQLVCLGAQYQIEHHLLPGANPLKLARASRAVKAFCRAHGYPYRCLGWGEGLVKSLRALRHPKPVYRLSQLIAAEHTAAGG